MRSYRWLVALVLLITTSYAWPELPHFKLQQAGNTNAASVPGSTLGSCKRINALMMLSNMAANQTIIDAMLADKKLTQEQVDYIEDKRDTINSELQKLSSNATLTSECDAINAHQKAVKDCKKLYRLEKLVEMANNKTTYNEHLASELLNQKQMEQLKKNMEDAEIKLQELGSNSTLVTLCTSGVGLQENGGVRQQIGDIGEGA